MPFAIHHMQTHNIIFDHEIFSILRKINILTDYVCACVCVCSCWFGLPLYTFYFIYLIFFVSYFVRFALLTISRVTYKAPREQMDSQERIKKEQTNIKQNKIKIYWKMKNINGYTQFLWLICPFVSFYLFRCWSLAPWCRCRKIKVRPHACQKDLKPGEFLFLFHFNLFLIEWQEKFTITIDRLTFN